MPLSLNTQQQQQSTQETPQQQQQTEHVETMVEDIIETIIETMNEEMNENTTNITLDASAGIVAENSMESFILRPPSSSPAPAPASTIGYISQTMGRREPISMSMHRGPFIPDNDISYTMPSSGARGLTEPSRSNIPHNINTMDENIRITLLFPPMELNTTNRLQSQNAIRFDLSQNLLNENSEIELLKYSSIEHPLDVRCPISLTDFTANSDVIRHKTCLHIFDKDSLVQWLQTRNTCPMCRRNIAQNQTRRIQPTPQTQPTQPTSQTRENTNFFTGLLNGLLLQSNQRTRERNRDGEREIDRDNLDPDVLYFI
jgi:hypothetical protein